MSELKITFTLRPRDVEYLRGILRKAAAESAELSESEIVDAALKVAGQVRAARPPDFVTERVEILESVATMLTDPDWTLPASVRKRVRTAVSYFANPVDLIHDQTPVLGFLDDAIMMELIGRELHHEVQGYSDFCRFRRQLARRRIWEGGATRGDRLHARRKQLRARIQARQQREASAAGGRRFRLW